MRKIGKIGDMIKHGISTEALDVALFSRVTQLSARSLASLLKGLTSNNDFAAMGRFFEFVKLNPDKLGPGLANNNFDDLDVFSTFSRIFLQPLAAPVQCDSPVAQPANLTALMVPDPAPWQQKQHDYFDALVDALHTHPRRKDFFEQMVFDGASMVSEPRFFRACFEAGAALDERRWSRTGNVQSFSILGEAIAHANSSGACALAALVPQAVIHFEMKSLLENALASGSSRTNRLLNMPTNDSASILLALQKRAVVESMTSVRLRLVTAYLGSCKDLDQSWKQDRLQLYAGPLGLNPELSTLSHLAKAHAKDVLGPLNALNGQAYHKAYGQRMRAMDTDVVKAAALAVQTHCTPLLLALEPVLSSVVHADHGASKGENGGINLGVLVNQKLDCDELGSLSFDRFKSSFEIMKRAGHDPLESDKNGRNLLHGLAAENTENSSGVAKLVHLLCEGVDPLAYDHRGQTPLDLIEVPEQKESWSLVVRSYLARTAAIEVMNEIHDVDASRDARCSA